MATTVVMPKFGLSMEEGTIVSWILKEGAVVQKGDALAEVTTDKITNTVESPADGVLRKILVQAEETVKCGVPIGIIAEANEDIAGASPEETPAASIAAVETVKAPAPVVKRAEEIVITPRAKKIAEEKGVDYTGIKGTGIGGAITIDDLKKHMSRSAEAVKPVQPVPVAAAVADAIPASAGSFSSKKMNQMQSTIAKRMFESISTTAQTTICTEADLSGLSGLYEQYKGRYAAEGYKLSYTAILIKAVAAALENHPKLRSMMDEGGIIRTNGDINIGVAVDIEEGLVVPVIKNANLKVLKVICKELSELTERAKRNQLSIEEMSGGAFTITNLGMFGITYFTPIINMPESAILGVGAITHKPIVREGGIHIAPVMNLSLTHDHRVIDGAPAARFLQELKLILGDFKGMF